MDSRHPLRSQHTSAGKLWNGSRHMELGCQVWVIVDEASKALLALQLVVVVAFNCKLTLGDLHAQQMPERCRLLAGQAVAEHAA